MRSEVGIGSAPTERTKVKRHPERGAYAPDLVRSILDEGLICHLGFVSGGKPVVIPTMYAREGESIFVHGSPASRMLTGLRDGIEASLCVTLLDGLVLARSAFSHSMNYRSVVIFGVAAEVTDPKRKRAAFKALVDHVAPGRWDDARQPSAKELKATLVLEMPLREASAKVRTGPPKDSADDLPLAVWAGELPLSLQPGEPVTSPDMSSNLAVPEYVLRYRRSGRARA